MFDLLAKKAQCPKRTLLDPYDRNTTGVFGGKG
jgi:hypothetical protein